MYFDKNNLKNRKIAISKCEKCAYFYEILRKSRIFADDIGTLIGRYSRYYEMIGKEIPENIRKVTFDSYNELV